MSDEKFKITLPFAPHQEGGGSAFPLSTENFRCYGMSMRDYFAESAPISLRDAMEVHGFVSTPVGYLDKSKRAEVFALLAQLRFEYADAMIAERAK